MTTTIRSRKVRRILRLEGQADRQATRETRATARATLLQRRVDALRTEARALEASLDGAQRAELVRFRMSLASSNQTDGVPLPNGARDAAPNLTPLVPRPGRRAGDGPRCPVMHGEAAAGGAEAAPEPEEA